MNVVDLTVERSEVVDLTDDSSDELIEIESAAPLVRASSDAMTESQSPIEVLVGKALVMKLRKRQLEEGLNPYFTATDEERKQLGSSSSDESIHSEGLNVGRETGNGGGMETGITSEEPRLEKNPQHQNEEDDQQVNKVRIGLKSGMAFNQKVPKIKFIISPRIVQDEEDSNVYKTPEKKEVQPVCPKAPHKKESDDEKHANLPFKEWMAEFVDREYTYSPIDFPKDEDTDEEWCPAILRSAAPVKVNPQPKRPLIRGINLSNR